MGRPRANDGRAYFEPTEEDRIKVQVLAACGMPQAEIAKMIRNPHTCRNIDLKTLRAHFRAELKDGKTIANAKVAESLFRKATGNSPQAVAAAIFWLRTQANWKAVDAVEVGGPDGKPLEKQSQVVVYLPDNGRGDLPVSQDGPRKASAVRH